jgi:hypothetical protein
MNQETVQQLSASQAYRKRFEATQTKIAALQVALTQHAILQTGDPDNYAFVSDLGWINEQIETCVAFLVGSVE